MNLENVQDSVQVSVINKKKLRDAAKSKLTEQNLGKKGKIKLSMKSIMVGAAAVWEFLYESVPLFSELVAGKIAWLQTEFYNFVAKISTQTSVDLSNLSPQEIFELGKSMQGDASVAVSKSPLGQIFAAVLQFIVENPTITILGGCALVGVLSFPVKKIVEAIKKSKEKNNGNNPEIDEQNSNYGRRL